MRHQIQSQKVQRAGESLLEIGTTLAVPVQSGEILAFSIPEFCRRHGISRAHFYNLSKNGDAPAVMHVGRRTLISAESAAKWRRRMEEAACDAEKRVSP